MRYEILDISTVEADPEVLQAQFVRKGDQDESNVYILTITYAVYYHSQAPDPFCMDSDWDYYGYTECDADVITVEVHKHDPEKDPEDHRTACVNWGLGEPVDNIDLNQVVSKKDWKEFRERIEENYVEYMSKMEDY